MKGKPNHRTNWYGPYDPKLALSALMLGSFSN